VGHRELAQDDQGLPGVDHVEELQRPAVLLRLRGAIVRCVVAGRSHRLG